MAQVQVLKSQVEAMVDDIEDFLDENPVKEIGNVVEDYDLVLTKIEELRSLYRQKISQSKPMIGDVEYTDTLSMQHLPAQTSITSKSSSKI